MVSIGLNSDFCQECLDSNNKISKRAYIHYTFEAKHIASLRSSGSRNVCVGGGGGDTKIHAAAFLGRIIFLEFHVMTKIWENETNGIPPNSIQFNSNRSNKWIYYVNEADRIG